MRRDIDDKIINVIKTGLNEGMEYINASSIFDRLSIRGIKISPPYFRERLKKMVDEGWLTRIGEKPGQHNPKPYSYALPSSKPEDVR